MFSLCTAIGIAVDITASHVLALALTRGELAGYAHGRIVHWPVWVDAKTLIASICQWMHHTNNCSLHFDNVSQTIGGSYYASLTYNIGEILNYRQYDTNFCLWRSRRGPGCIWVTACGMRRPLHASCGTPTDTRYPKQPLPWQYNSWLDIWSWWKYRNHPKRLRDGRHFVCSRPLKPKRCHGSWVRAA